MAQPTKRPKIQNLEGRLSEKGRSADSTTGKCHLLVGTGSHERKKNQNNELKGIHTIEYIHTIRGISRVLTDHGHLWAHRLKC